jgi:hypothetical protein
MHPAHYAPIRARVMNSKRKQSREHHSSCLAAVVMMTSGMHPAWGHDGQNVSDLLGMCNRQRGGRTPLMRGWCEIKKKQQRKSRGMKKEDWRHNCAVLSRLPVARRSAVGSRFSLFPVGKPKGILHIYIINIKLVVFIIRLNMIELGHTDYKYNK